VESQGELPHILLILPLKYQTAAVLSNVGNSDVAVNPSIPANPEIAGVSTVSEFIGLC
jgi:hypothetical protein